MDNAFLSPADVRRMENAAKCNRDALMIRLLFHLGCRISELLPLTAGQVDPVNNIVEVKLLKQRLKVSCPLCGGRLSRQSRFCQSCGQPVEKAVEEAKDELVLRRLSLDKPTMAMAQDFIEHVRLKPESRLFPIEYRRAYGIIVAAALKARVHDLVNPNTGKRRHVSPHRLRDAFATMAAGRDSDPKAMRVLQERLGHAKMDTTWKYVKIAGQEQEAWNDRLWEEPEERTSEDN